MLFEGLKMEAPLRQAQGDTLKQRNVTLSASQRASFVRRQLTARSVEHSLVVEVIFCFGQMFCQIQFHFFEHALFGLTHRLAGNSVIFANFF